MPELLHPPAASRGRAGTEALAQMRDANSRTLESDDVDEYVAEFNQAVIDRMPRFGRETKNLISKSPNHGL